MVSNGVLRLSFDSTWENSDTCSLIDDDGLTLPPDITESGLPAGQVERRKRAKKARKLQVQRYQEWEQGLGAMPARARSRGRRRGESVKKVGFQAKERLRDAVVRSDQREGEASASGLYNNM